MCDFTEKHLLVRPQVRRRFLPDEGFSVEKRHLSAPLPPAALWKTTKRRETGSQTPNMTHKVPSTQVKLDPRVEAGVLDRKQRRRDRADGVRSRRAGLLLDDNLPTWKCAPHGPSDTHGVPGRPGTHKHTGTRQNTTQTGFRWLFTELCNDEAIIRGTKWRSPRTESCSLAACWPSFTPLHGPHLKLGHFSVP